jgi:predicted nucleic acid-binding protein
MMYISYSFWANLIVTCALSARASILYSEDMQDGLVVASQLEIVNPFK